MDYGYAYRQADGSIKYCEKSITRYYPPDIIDKIVVIQQALERIPAAKEKCELSDDKLGNCFERHSMLSKFFSLSDLNASKSSRTAHEQKTWFSRLSMENRVKFLAPIFGDVIKESRARYGRNFFESHHQDASGNNDSAVVKTGNDDAKAMYDLAMTLVNEANAMYESGMANEAADERNFNKVMDLLNKSAEAGYPDAMYELANAHLIEAKQDEDGYDTNLVKQAVTLLEKASEMGHARSQGKLGGIYMGRLDLKIPKDTAKGIALLRVGTNGGCSYAKVALAVCHGTGDGVDEDLEVAERMAKEALRDFENANDADGISLAQTTLNAIMDYKAVIDQEARDGAKHSQGGTPKPASNITIGDAIPFYGIFVPKIKCHKCKWEIYRGFFGGVKGAICPKCGQDTISHSGERGYYCYMPMCKYQGKSIPCPGCHEPIVGAGGFLYRLFFEK